ncbi:MAG: NAD(+) diphosphatase [Desulfuromonadales bacterium]|jgi:NAD+ diphosphatase|nr:NAD(+) diphosphatase [Desulfuromonadales bacterium]
MIGLPRRYRSPDDLPFNSSCLEGRFHLQSPDGDLGGEGVWLVLVGDRLLIRGTEQGDYLPEELPEALLPEAPLFIGTWDGVPCRLVRLSRDTAVPTGLRPESLVSQEPALPIELLTLGGLGRMILHWEDASRYCASCGRTMRRLAGEWGKVCQTCGSHHFPHIHPCVIVLVRRPGEVLLARKPEWAPNRYSLVAGFLEFGESLEEAVVREVAEETGVSIKNLRYVGSQCWPFPSQIMTGFVADYAGGELVVQESELEDARWFPVDELPNLPPKRSIARYLLDTVLELP